MPLREKYQKLEENDKFSHPALVKHVTFDHPHFKNSNKSNFNLKEVRMKRGGEWHVIIENFRPSKYIMEALAGG